MAPWSRKQKPDVTSSTSTSSTKKDDVDTPTSTTDNEKPAVVDPQSTVADETATGDDLEKVKTKDAEEDIVYPHGLKLGLILLALCLSVFLVALDQTIIATAIPKM